MNDITATAQNLSSPIKFSHGRNKFDNKPKQLEVASPEEFIEFIKQIRANKKGKDYLASAFMPGQHDDPVKNPGVEAFRLKRLAAPSRFMAFDIDDVSAPRVADALRQVMSVYLGIAYTTASHTDDEPRFRAILIANREMTHEERVVASKAVEAELMKATSIVLGQQLNEFDIKFDRSVYRAEQPCYLPIVGAKTKRLNGHEVNVDALINNQELTQQNINHLPAEFNLYRSTQPETTDHIEQVQQALTTIPAAKDLGCDYDCWRNILWALASTDWGCAKGMAKAWSQQSPADFNDADFERTWASYNPKKHSTLSVGTLFHIAKQHGYSFPDDCPLDNYALTDTGNSLRFADAFAGHLRYVHGIEEWLYWSSDESRWTFCTMDQQVELAKKFVQEMLKVGA